MRLFGRPRDKGVSSGQPWLEFPNNTDRSPEEALTRGCAILWDSQLKPRVAEIEGQGVGSHANSYEITSVKVFMRVVHLDGPITEAARANIERLGIPAVKPLENGRGFDLTATITNDAARILHEIFISHFQLKPYNERGHYNVAAYWV
jgi:hypothetical protein